MLTLQKFEAASEIVKNVTKPTKLVYSEYLSQQTGGKVYLKPENMQFTGAYKLRGAYYAMSTLSEEERAKGVITASAGNHAQGVAYAAKSYGVKATIVMPTTTPLMKVNRTKGYGAEVILYGDVYDEACNHAYKLAEEHGYTFIHPFDDPAVATGQGTIAMEIFKELPLVDTILVPVVEGTIKDIIGKWNAQDLIANREKAELNLKKLKEQIDGIKATRPDVNVLKVINEEISPNLIQRQLSGISNGISSVVISC